MPRINALMPDGRTGHFMSESATRYAEQTDWDGSNHISIATGSQWDHQALWRTKGGRWVLNAWSNRQGVRETWRFIDNDAAKEWLLRNDEDDAVEKWFGEVEDEIGPDLGGRPEIGGRIDVMIGNHLRDTLDAHAATLGMTRAEAVRLLLADALKFGKER